MKSFISTLLLISQNFLSYWQVLDNIVIAILYYLIALNLIYFIYQYQYKKLKIIFSLFSLLFCFQGSTYILESKILAANFPESYYLINQNTTALILSFIICTIIIFKSQNSDPISDNQLSGLIQHLTEQKTGSISIKPEISKSTNQVAEKVIIKTTAHGLVNQELRAKNFLMEKVANLTPNVLYIYDLEKKCNVYSNRFVGEILDYSAPEIEESNVQLFDQSLQADDLNLVAQHHENCLTLGQDDYLELEYRMKDCYGKLHWLHSKDTIFKRNASGKPTQILGITQDITETKKNQSQSVVVNTELAEKVKTLEIWHEKKIKLGEMNEFLQACLTIEEAAKALPDLLQPLFPNTHGAVYLINNSQNLLDEIAVWGITNNGTSFDPKECWALRRGNSHQAHPHTPGLYCAHVDSETDLTPTLCLPMIAKGQTLGMFYLRFDDSEKISKSLQELADTVAQNIAMSFANLKLQELLRYQSLRDPLTSLYNRRYLQESLVKEIERAERNQQFISIIMLDIDHFKRFNDLYGHSAGDFVLKEVGFYLLSQIRQYDIACRYGGEELVIVMPDASIEDAIIRAEGIREGIKQLKLEHEGKELDSISVSIGVSCFPDSSTDADGLIRAADKALYQAKEQGRDCVKHC